MCMKMTFPNRLYSIRKSCTVADRLEVRGTVLIYIFTDMQAIFQEQYCKILYALTLQPLGIGSEGQLSALFVYAGTNHRPQDPFNT